MKLVWEEGQTVYGFDPKPIQFPRNRGKAKYCTTRWRKTLRKQWFRMIQKPRRLTFVGVPVIMTDDELIDPNGEKL